MQVQKKAKRNHDVRRGKDVPRTYERGRCRVGGRGEPPFAHLESFFSPFGPKGEETPRMS